MSSTNLLAAPVPGSLTREARPRRDPGRTLAALSEVREAEDWGWVEVSEGTPTAAFSRRDTLAAGYASAVETAHRHGFEPLVRPVGGRLAAYHEGALIVEVLARHSDPARDVEHRFRTFGEAVAGALRRLGVDARVGQVPGEYCPGRFSVNSGGRTKIAGTAQRLTKGSYLLSAVVLVSDPDPIRAVLTDAYPHLGLAWVPDTVGSLADHVGAVTTQETAAALLAALRVVLPLGSSLAHRGTCTQRVALTGSWDAPT